MRTDDLSRQSSRVDLGHLRDSRDPEPPAPSIVQTMLGPIAADTTCEEILHRAQRRLPFGRMDPLGPEIEALGLGDRADAELPSVNVVVSDGAFRHIDFKQAEPCGASYQRQPRFALPQRALLREDVGDLQHEDVETTVSPGHRTEQIDVLADVKAALSSANSPHRAQ